MADRIYTCLSCGVTEETPGLSGRLPEYCESCRRDRKNARQRADRANVRVANTACQRCGGPIPAGSRGYRMWCSPACQMQASRRTTGQVQGNDRACSSCGKLLVGMQSHARICRSRRCRTWATRHPGVPHPSTQPRRCGRCDASIDHRNGKAKYCGKSCGEAARVDENREAYNARQRRWQATQQGRAQRRAYQLANAEERRRWARDARQRDPDRYRGYWKQWAEANPGLVRENERVRRARKIGNPGSVGVSLRDWQRLVRRYRGCCAYCGDVAEPLHMDHVIPLARGGRHAIGNVVPACGRCNFAKHAMLPVVFRYRRAWLAA